MLITPSDPSLNSVAPLHLSAELTMADRITKYISVRYPIRPIGTHYPNRMAVSDTSAIPLVTTAVMSSVRIAVQSCHQIYCHCLCVSADGELWCNDECSVNWGPKYGATDAIVCLVDYRSGDVSFFRNGVKVGTYRNAIASSKPYHFALTLGQSNQSVTARLSNIFDCECVCVTVCLCISNY